MFTFDDGYANNLAAIDLLEQAGVPVMLSVNPDIARSGESFWWDVLYRELHRRGATPAQIDDERLRLIRAEPAAIRRELAGRFGEDALRPIDDHDRPLTLAEVRALAARPGVSFANHTSDHQWLVGRDRDVVTVALQRAQQDLLELVGSAPPAVTYPYGRYDDVTLECCRSLGFEVGFSGDFGKARLPHGLRGAARLQLPRCVIFGDRSIADQCENTHTEWRLSWTIRGWMRNLRAPGPARAAWP
jgi:peptidoglycan/xylan/chitin deacetylase (PgdA/CDA1 family)